MDEVINKRFKNETKNENNTDMIDHFSNKNKKRTKKKKLKKKKKNSQKNFLGLSANDNEVQKNNKKNNSTMFQINNKNKEKEKSKIKPDTDYELNWLSYKEAIKYDKRSNCEYYGSLLSCKQLFIFTFCSFNDYNSGVIKKFMLFLSFALHYTVNALFFDESNLHQIYEDEGKYNFKYQISFILFSAIISTVFLRLLLQFLVLTDKEVLKVKNQNNKALAINMKKNQLKYIKIKFAIFFVLNFILLVLFWYYLTCFNAIYQNTQVYLIENTFISFGFSLFYPFVINIFPVIIRMNSIHAENKKREYLYKISQIMQLI